MKANKKLIADICRILLGAVFIFSGFMKCIDTWGTAQKVGEYLTAFGMDWLGGLSVAGAVLLSAAEMTMGLMLVFGVRLRLSTLAAFIFMIGFTIVTLIIAVWNPLDDCGCFGEALRIDNWHSFIKNIGLLALSFVAWYFNRQGRFFSFSRRELIMTGCFLVVSVSLGIGSYRHQPPFDLFPFRKGVDIARGALCTACADQTTVLIYRNLQTGQLHEFSLDDTEWYDSQKWEYVDTRSELRDLTPAELEKDFAVFDGEYNIAGEILLGGGLHNFIVIRDPANVPARCMERLAGFADAHLGSRMTVLTVWYEDEQAPAMMKIGGTELPVYTMKPKALGYLLRADNGVVVVEGGSVVSKKNCRDVRY